MIYKVEINIDLDFRIINARFEKGLGFFFGWVFRIVSVLAEITERQHIGCDVSVNHLGLSVQEKLDKLKQEEIMLA